MKFSLETYKLIDYKQWDFSGLGANIYHLLTPIEKRIWREAIPVQDMRDDEGQGEVVTLFTLRLLDYIDANREIAVPAAILHDTGFSRIPNAGDAHRAAAKAGKAGDVSYRKIHQDFGVEIAKEILWKLNYNPSHIQKICEIIGDHDTRLNEPSLDGKVMMDADILWRFTLPQFNAYKDTETPTGSLTELLSRYERIISKPKRFYTQEGIALARVEFANTLMRIYPDGAQSILEPNYSAELERLSKQ